jgi:hypothetical protein
MAIVVHHDDKTDIIMKQKKRRNSWRHAEFHSIPLDANQSYLSNKQTYVCGRGGPELNR